MDAGTDSPGAPPSAGAELEEDGLSSELRRRLPGHDPVALEAFFDAYFDRVHGYVRSLVRDEHLAEDLTQEVFFHVHRGLSTYDPERALRPWVFTIATNKIRDHWRSRRHAQSRREESVDAVPGLEHVAGEEGAPERVLTAAEMEDELRAAVEGLPDGMRMTVLLRVYEEMSFEAIGEILDRTEVAVRKRYSRALETLRKELGPAWRTHVDRP